MIKYCIWDVGQTIYPYSLDPLYQWGLQHTCNQKKYQSVYGVKSYNYNRYMSGKITNEQFAQELCTHCGIDYDQTKLIEINKRLHFGVGHPFLQTIETMHFLAHNNIKNGLLSNALPLLEDTSIAEIDKACSFPSYKTGLLKPDKKAFQNVKENLACSYAEMIFIDDKIHNVQAAQELGIQALKYNSATILKDVKQIVTGECKKLAIRNNGNAGICLS